MHPIERFKSAWTSRGHANRNRGGVREILLASVAGLGFLCLGIALLLWGFRSMHPTSQTKRMAQPIPIESVSRFRTHGFYAPLPKLSPEVAALIESQWTIDSPDNGESPTRCGHGILVNGVRLPSAHRAHQAIGDSERGSYSVWGKSIGSSAVYFSLPGGTDALKSLEVEWRLTVPIEPPARQAFLALAGWAAAGCFLLTCCLRPRTLGWAGTCMLACAGASFAGPVLAILWGRMDQASMETLHHAAIMSDAWISAATLSLALLIALSGGRWNCLGDRLPATVIMAALATGVVANHFVIGRTCFDRAPTPFDASGAGSALVANRLPFSDAGGWFLGSQAVTHGAELTWSARRPLHACIRAGQLVLGGGYDGSLALQAVLLIAAATALACAAWHALSPAAAITVLLAILQASEGFERSFLSECTGLSISCIAATLLILGWKRSSPRLRFSGAASLGAAWLVRPGPLALLLLPTVTEWITRQPHRWRRGLIALAMVGGMLLAGKGLFRSLASETAVENDNAAPVAYGLATGMRWDQAYTDFGKARPESASMPLRERTALMYQEAWHRLWENPRPCLQRLSTDLWDGFKMSVVMLPSKLWIWPAWTGVSRWPNVSLVIGFGLLAASTIIAVDRRAWFGSVATCLGIAAAASIVSLPIIWGDGKMRATILAVPFVVSFLSLPIAMLQRVRAAPGPIPGVAQRAPHLVAMAILATFVLAGLIAFAASRGNAHKRLPLHIDLQSTPSVVLTDTWRDHGVLGTASAPIDIVAKGLETSMPQVYGLDTFLRSLHAGTALLLKGQVELGGEMIVVEGVGDRVSGHLIIERIEPTPNRYFVRATEWRWVD